jgi:probable phosphoglycerate mutase
MDWGDWEGQRLAVLRAAAPEAMAENEARGLDFRPPGGESPREVCARLAALVAELAQERTPVVAVTHKGVMRAALVLATGWNMRGKPPWRLQRDRAFALAAFADGRLELAAAPVPLAA